jgi:hypothetical protein
MAVHRQCFVNAAGIALLLVNILSLCDAWTAISPSYGTAASRSSQSRTSPVTVLQSSASSPQQKSEEVSRSGTTIINREEASKESPPSSFWELHPKSVRAVLAAMKDGHRLLEIEYPPLAASVMEQDDIGAYQVSRANFDLALEFCKSLRTTAQLLMNQDDDLNIAILFPDDAELKIAMDDNKKYNVNMMAGDPQKPYPGIMISSLRTNGDIPYDESDKRSFKVWRGCLCHDKYHDVRTPNSHITLSVSYSHY